MVTSVGVGVVLVNSSGVGVTPAGVGVVTAATGAVFQRTT